MTLTSWDLPSGRTPQSYSALSDYLLTYSYPRLFGIFSAIIFVLGAWWLRTAPFYDAVPVFYLRAHIGKSVSRLIPSDAGVGFDVSNADFFPPLALQLSVCCPHFDR